MPYTGTPPNQVFERTDGTRTGATVWQEADAAGVDIVDDDHDTHDQDIASGFNQVLKRDGGNTATANIPMGGNRFTNMGKAQSPNEALTFDQGRDQEHIYVATVGGTANAITLTSAAGLAATAYVAGQKVSFIAALANTGSVSVNLDTVGAVTVKRVDGVDLQPNDILAGGMVELVHDGTNFQLGSAALNGSSGDLMVRAVAAGDVILTLTNAPRTGFVRLGEAIQNLLKADYPELNSWASDQGYPWGSDTTTFGIPPAAGYFARFAGTTAAIDPDGPRGAGTTQADMVGPHLHTGTTDGHTHTISAGTVVTSGSGPNAAGGGASSYIDTLVKDQVIVPSATDTFTTDTLAGAVETRGKNVAMHADMLARTAEAALAAFALAGFAYSFSTDTDDSDPGSGKLKFNNADISSATEMYISTFDQFGVGVASTLDNLEGAGITVKKVSAPGEYITFIAGAIGSASGYRKIPVTAPVNLTAALAIADGRNLDIQATGAGPTGADGATGPVGPNLGLDYAWDTGTGDANPGNGNIRANNADLSSATFLFISKTDRNGNDKSVQIARWGASTTPGDRGEVFIRNTGDAGQDGNFQVTTSLTDAGTYFKVPVAPGSIGNTIAAAAIMGVLFTRTGDKGTDGGGAGDVIGPAGATDNALARFDTTTGKLIQGSPVTLDDSGNLNGGFGHAEFTQTTTPATPAANVARLYTKDVGGLSKWFFVNDAGSDIQLLDSTDPVISSDGVFEITNYGAVGDGQSVAGCSIVSGDNTLTAPASTFVAADAGKRIAVENGISAGVDLITTIASFTSDTSVELTIAPTNTDASVAIMFGTDDTAAIHAARDDAKVNGGVILFGNNTYVTGPLAFNSMIGVNVTGVGRQSGAGPTNFGTHVWPLVAAASGVPALDFSGSSHCALRNIQVGRSDLLGEPNTGILIAGKVGTESTHLEIDHCFCIGTFSNSALYVYGAPDCEFDRSQFYNYRNNSASAAVIVTATNIRSVTSPNETLNTGNVDTSSFKFRDCHIIERGNTTANSLLPAFLLDGVSNFLVDGCNVASTSTCVVIADQVSGRPGEEIVIRNSILAGAYATVGPEYGVRVDSTFTIRGISLLNNIYNDDGDGTSAGGPSAAIVGMHADGRIDSLRMKGYMQASGTAKVVANTSSGTPDSALVGQAWDIDCSEMPITYPGSVYNARITQPGTTIRQTGATEAIYGRTIEKAGSAAGNYTTSAPHTTIQDVDATNLAFTTVIPKGMSLRVEAKCNVNNSIAGSGCLVAIDDNGAVCDQSDVTSPAAGQILFSSVRCVIAGDDNSHTIKLRWNAITSGTCLMRNSSVADAPKMTFEFVEA